MVPALPGFIGSDGWVRSNAWVWVFSSKHNTTARSAFDPSGFLSYVQARYLDPSATSKYGNPIRRLGTNPGLAWTRTPTVRYPDQLIVCEGVLDALTAATAGLPAVAVLGATYPSVRIAQTIADHTADRRILIAFRR
ncbi:MAG TPA: hypothetical protein VMS99_08445 [Acidimicrobiia bacterium]|nr:hypothetical protein [Acidimicrobiia bacterium]